MADLANCLDVSEMTIRRDLVELERSGLINRVHGGAVSARGTSYEPPLYLRREEHQHAKELIGIYAASLVSEGDSLSIDVGSTTYEVALHLVKRKNLTVVTPSFHIAGLLLQQPGIRVILTGGILRNTEGSLIGEPAIKTIESFFVDKLFLGVGAIDEKVGFTEYNLDDTLVKKAMIRNAKEVIVVADSSKFQKIAFASVGPLQIAQKIITEKAPPPTMLKSLHDANVEIILVNEDGHGKAL